MTVEGPPESPPAGYPAPEWRPNEQVQNPYGGQPPVAAPTPYPAYGYGYGGEPPPPPQMPVFVGVAKMPVPWGLLDIVWAVLVYIVIFAAVIVGFFVITLGITLLQGQSLSSQTLSPNGPLLSTFNIVVGIIFELLLGVVAWIFSVWRYKVSPASLGLRKTNLWLAARWVVGLFVCILVGLYAWGYVGEWLHHVFSWFPIDTNVDQLVQQTKSNPNLLIAELALAVLAAPIPEEIFFRGFILQALNKRMPFWAAAIISGAIFAIAHLSPGSLVPLFIFGFALAWLFKITGSIWPGVVVHFSFNLFAAVSTLAIILPTHH